jgi:UDP-N-acetylglucosamine pyrophosphorylase
MEVPESNTQEKTSNRVLKYRKNRVWYNRQRFKDYFVSVSADEQLDSAFSKICHVIRQTKIRFLESLVKNGYNEPGIPYWDTGPPGQGNIILKVPESAKEAIKMFYWRRPQAPESEHVKTET